MPWSETTAMDQRAQFIRDWMSHKLTISDLCHLYDVSRKTGYKWIDRFVTYGPDGLIDRSHVPRTSPHRTPKETEDVLLMLRLKHPRWGARKLVVKAHERYPKIVLPHPSTVNEILRRNHLVQSRPKRRQIGHPGRPSVDFVGPNDCWSGDFKGQFKLGNGQYCYPLTVSDNFSRYLFCCHALPGPYLIDTKAVLTRVFREFGLPRRFRTDNGSPFAAYTLGRLSQLSVWLIRLGVMPELIVPGKPQQNGRHERMHKTLKDETTKPPAATMQGQQRKFNAFLREFNDERPHEALDMQTPAKVHQPSPREMPRKLLPIIYPDRFEVRLVSTNGGIRWHHGWINVSGALAGEYVGFEEIEDGLWDVYFGPKRIGRLHERLMRIEDCYGNLSRRV